MTVRPPDRVSSVVRMLLACAVLFSLFLRGALETAALADSLHVHVVCPAHGELIHAVAGDVEDRGSRVAEIRNAPSLDHEPGCVVPLLANGQLDPALPTPARVRPPPVWLDAPATVVASVRSFSKRNCLEFAPKTSPPQA